MASPSAACPRCGAGVPFGAHPGALTCTYCGTSFSAPAMGTSPGAGKVPVGCIVGALGLMVLIAGGAAAAFFALGAKRSGVVRVANEPTPAVSEADVTPGAATAKARAKERAPRLEGRARPLLADLNGDAAGDVVVAASVHEEGGLKRRYVAFDGKTGAELWRSGEIGSDIFNSSAVLEHSRLMVVNRTGTVTAYDARSGVERWQQSLGERVTAACKAKEPESVRFTTADGRTVALDVRNGQQRPIAGKPACERANTNQDDRFSHDPADRSDSNAPAGVRSVVCGGVRVMGDRNFTLPEQCKAQFRVDPDAIPGMSARSLWQHDGGFLVFGSRRPGTRVPMVGLLKGGKLVWSAEVPDKDPLEAREGAPQQVALDGPRVFVAYEPQSGNRPAAVTAFDVGTGARSWHVTLPGKLRSVAGLAASGGGVFVSAGDNLVALDAADGKTRFSLGDGD